MNYLRISNKGLICAEDLTLIGSSTKREQVGKIGMFGSGWKYALAWLLRNGCMPTIYAGNDKIDVDFTVKMHRNNPVNVITVDGIETSLTTEMGPKWTGWMALREILSNAIDEGEHTISTQWSPQMQGVSDQTVIFVPMSSELSEVMMKYDKYFAFNRKESYVTNHGRIFIKQEPSEMNIYRRGIRCYDTNKKTMLDFDFNDISINEDRLTSDWEITLSVRQIVEDCNSALLLKHILLEGNTDWLPYNISDNTLVLLKELINSGETFTTPTLVKLGGMLFSDPNALYIRADWYKKLQDLGLVKSPFDMLDGNETFMRTDAKDLSGVKYYLKGFGVDVELLSGKCESEVLFNNSTGYVKDDTHSDDKTIASLLLGKMKSKDFLPYLK